MSRRAATVALVAAASCGPSSEPETASTNRAVSIDPVAEPAELESDDPPERDGRPAILDADRLRTLFGPGLRGCFPPELTGVCAFTLSLDKRDEVTAADYECDRPLAAHAPCFRATMTGARIEAGEGDLVTFELHLGPAQALDLRHVKRFTFPPSTDDTPAVPALPADD